MIRAVADPQEEKKKEPKRPQRTRTERRGTMRRITLSLTAILVALLLAGLFIPVTNWVDGSGYLMTDQEVELRSSVEGAIDTWLVKSGDVVEKDQIVIKLASAVQRADYEESQSQLAATEAELSQLMSAQQLDRARRKEQVLRAEQNFQLAEAYLSRMLASEGFSPKEVDESRLRVAIAQSELAELQLPVEDLREKQINVLHEQIEAARKQVAANEAQLREREIRAPLPGTVQLNRFEPGEVVKPEHVLGQIFDRKAWVVKLSLPEQDIAHVRIGQDVQVAIAAYPRLKYGYVQGKISGIIPVITPRPNAPGIFYVEAKITVPDNMEIQPGMSATAWVDAGETTWIKRKLGW